MDTKTQFTRYVLVGLASNLVLYLAYLALTAWGMGPKPAMSLLYALGVAQTFVFNRKWSFRHQGGFHGTFARYVVAYAFGYILNLTVLWLAVDRLGLPHQLVQGVMILTLAAGLVAKLAGMGAMGPLNAQILHTAEGCWVSDLNPRIDTSMPLSLAAGQNPVEFLFDGPATATPMREATPGGRTLRFPQERGTCPTLAWKISPAWCST